MSHLRCSASNNHTCRIYGVMDSVLVIRPKVRGFKPGGGNEFVRAIKIRNTPFFGGEFKSETPSKDFTACKVTFKYEKNTGPSGFDPLQKRKIFPVASDRIWSPPSLLYNGYWGPFLGAKARPGRDADHSPYLVTRSRISRSYTSCPPKRLRGV
jgi:hypothetical protein